MTEVRAERTRWAGWVVLAALTLVVVGAVQVVQALVAFFRPSYYYVPASALAVRLDYSAWGWLQLLMGLLMLAAGYGLLAGQAWARMTAVVLAGLSAIANLTFVAAYPWWALTLIALDVVDHLRGQRPRCRGPRVLTGSSRTSATIIRAA